MGITERAVLTSNQMMRTLIAILALATAGGRAIEPAAISGGASPRKPDAVWVAVEDGARLVKVDTSKRRVVRSYQVPAPPHNLAVSSEGVVVATFQARGSIVILRKGRLREVQLGGSPHDVKIARGMAIVANERAARLNRVTLKGDVRRSIPLKANPHDLAISPSKRRAWVTLDGTDDIAIVDLRRRRVRRYLSTERSPHDVLFAPDGRVWVTDWNGDIHVFSRKRKKRIKTFERGAEPHHLAFDPNGRTGWITDHGARRVFVVSVRRLKILKVRKAWGLPHHVAVTANGRRVAVADHEGGRLVLFHADTRRHVGTVPVGAGPHGVWARP